MKRFNFVLEAIILMLLIANTSVAFSQPQQRYPGGWYVELEPFAARINDGLSEFQFAHVFSDTDFHDRFVQFDNKEVFGVYVAAGYDFSSCACCHWGLSLAYTYFNKDDHRSHDLADDEDRISPTFGPLPFDNFTSTNGKLDTTYNAVDLLAHYRCFLCNCTQLDLFGGARYVNIDEELKADFIFISDPLARLDRQRNLRLRLENDIKGIGPELGVGINFPVYRCFGLTGQIAGSVLKVKHDQELHTHFVDSLPTFTTLSDSNLLDSHDENKWIPAVSANAGITYQMLLRNCSCIRAELGYRYDVYFNLDQDDFSNCQCTGSDDRNNRFEFQGPYFKLSWHL